MPGGGNDTVAGGLGNDLLDGGLGNDQLLGGGDHDKLTGSQGNDDLRGDTGNDTLWGGEGQDYLNGGLGADRFVFTTMDYGSMDHVGDFTSGQDKIDLSAFDGRADLEYDQALWYRGAADFIGGGQGSVRFQVISPSYTNVHVDVNGDALTDLTIQLSGLTAPTPTVFDFVL
jgi:Ca2+-binding RTX toxin-like protein